MIPVGIFGLSMPASTALGAAAGVSMGTDGAGGGVAPAGSASANISSGSPIGKLAGGAPAPDTGLVWSSNILKRG